MDDAAVRLDRQQPDATCRPGRRAARARTGTTGSTSGSREHARTTSSSRASCWRRAAGRGRATTTTARRSARTSATTRPADFAERETMPHFWARQNFRTRRGPRAGLLLRLPGHPAAVRPVPQAPVRPVDEGGLRPVQGVLRRRALRRGPRHEGRKRQDARRAGFGAGSQEAD